jgi:hypothetical protein
MEHEWAELMIAAEAAGRVCKLAAQTGIRIEGEGFVVVEEIAGT